MGNRQYHCEGVQVDILTGWVSLLVEGVCLGEWDQMCRQCRNWTKTGFGQFRPLSFWRSLVKSMLQKIIDNTSGILKLDVDDILG